MVRPVSRRASCVLASLDMRWPTHSPARWIRLVLACLALAALAPAQAVAVTAEPVTLVEGGPSKAPPVRASRRVDRYTPPAADPWGDADPALVPEASCIGVGESKRLFLLHRALLR